MNVLLEEMRRSMEEMRLGLDGALNFSPAMEALSSALAQNKVRGGRRVEFVVGRAHPEARLVLSCSNTCTMVVWPQSVRRCRKCGWPR